MGTLLRNTREKKGLSQRELSAISGVRQSQISKIEKGTVDLRLSSLIELARALELELTLVPRPAVPAVQSIVRSTTPPSGPAHTTRRLSKALRGLEGAVDSNRSALDLDPEEFVQLKRQLRDLAYFRLTDPERKEIETAYKAARHYLNDPKNRSTFLNALAHLKRIRNAHAHGIDATSISNQVRPAYTLDEDDNG